MSTVYKARAPVTGRVVALKILRPRDEIFEDLVGKDRLQEIFLEEAMIMGAITHDHVAKIIDCDEDDGIPFMVLEYFSHSVGELIGEAYRVELESRQLSVPRARLYVSQTLKGLERLHFAGIIHRDIKPYNLMITNDDRVKIIDFGLSRVRGEEKMAIPGMQVGSPYYAAPEQEKRPEEADARADIYSVGVLLYRMLTGQLVDPRHDHVRLPSELNPVLDSGWDALIMKALALEPEQRFDTALAMRVALEELYQEWTVSSRESCALPVADVEKGILPPGRTVGSQPGRIMFKDMRERLGLDELFRPLSLHVHQLERIDSQLLFDQVTRLYWQRTGSGFTLNWHQAKEYVSHLNSTNFHGRRNWRLPTTSELATILRSPSVYRDFCVDPNFDPSLHWLWSSDHCTKKTAWCVDLVESYIGRLDTDGTASVCAVSGCEDCANR